MLYMISYDLADAEPNRARLDAYIRKFGGREVLRSQWLVASNNTANAIWMDITEQIDNSERLLVTELTKNTEWRKDGLMIGDADMEGFLVLARG